MSARSPLAPAPRLVCLGLSAFDISWSVDALPAGAGKQRAREFREGGGGMAANAAAAAAQLGAKVAFWGRAGDDRAGVAMRDELAGCGVDVAAFRLFAGARSSVSGIVVDRRGDRAIVNFRGAGWPDDASWLPLDEVTRADCVLADPRWPEGAIALFDAARAHGVPTVLDGDVAEAHVFDTLLPRVDCAVFSEPGLAGYVGGAAIADGLDGDEARLRLARARGCNVAAVTLGEQGLAWLDVDGMHRLPALAVEAVDTTGAGDVFHGALAHALGAGAVLADAFAFATVVAGLKCRHAGGRSGVPDLATARAAFERFRREHA